MDTASNPRTWIAAVVASGGPGLFELSEHRPARRLTNADDVMPSLSPDGTLVAFSRAGGARRRSIWTLELATGLERQVTAAATFDGGPVFLGNDVVAFTRAVTDRETSTFGHRWVDWDVFTVSTGTRVEKRITAKQWRDVGPLSAFVDGRSVALSVEARSGPREFLVLGLDGGVVSHPTRGDATGGVLSPDAQMLVVTRQTTTRPSGLFNYDFFASRLGQPQELRLTALETYLEAPRFSRDGAWLFFLRDDGEGPLTAWSVGTDGTRPARLSLQLP